MAVFSKPLSITPTCYELGHCWTPYCRQAAKDIFGHVFKEALKIYGTLYFVAALLRRKEPSYFVKKIIPETLRSTVFLTVNGTLFMVMFCVWRHLVGFYMFYNVYLCTIPACIVSLLIEQKSRTILGCTYLLTASFVPAYIAAFTAVCLERKSRRGPLAVYLTNLAIETGYRMLVERKLLKPINNGEVYIFSAVSAIYLYLYRKQNGLPSSTQSLFRFLVGPEESHKEGQAKMKDVLSSDQGAMHQSSARQACTSRNINGLERSSHGLLDRVKSGLLAVPFVGGLVQEVVSLVTGCLDYLEDLPRHLCCPHNHSCVSYVIKGGVRMFSIGFLIQAALTAFSSLSTILKKPKAVFSKVNLNLALFLGSFCTIFRAVNCVLRLCTNKDSEMYGLVAGALAGLSLKFYKSVTIALYAATKLIEILYFKGIRMYNFPYVKSADIFIYALSTAFIFHAAVMEPHTLRPAYWKFLLRVTQNKFALMNRQLLDVFGVHSSKLYPEYWPDYVPGFSQLTKPKH